MSNRRSPSGPELSWQEPVATAAALPAAGNGPGDARVTLDASMIWVWDGTTWVLVGGGGAIYPVPDNVFAVNDNLDPTKFLNVELAGQAAGTTQTITTNATVSRPFRLPDIDGTAVVVQDVTGKVYMGLGVVGDVIASNAGIQYSTITSNRAQLRANQFGAHSAGPGATGFKSRGATIGALAGCVGGDLLYRITAIGVAPNNVDIPLAGTVTIQIPPGFVAAAQNYVPTEYEVALVPLAGPINSRRAAQLVTSEGETAALNGVRVGGPATTPATIATVGALIRSGNGNPNGVITGSVGDLWLRLDGSAGAVLYIKESGAATTSGWVSTRIQTAHADNGAIAYPLPAFPAFTTVATTPVTAVEAGQRVLPSSRVLAEITAGGGTMLAGVFANPIVPPGAPIIIDYTETTVTGSPKQTMTSAGAEVTLPAGTYTFSLVVSSTALVTGTVPATGVGYPIPPAVLTVTVLSP